jgi:N-acetylglutamate synthase/N-acetylornithine aminotransferase
MPTPAHRTARNTQNKAAPPPQKPSASKASDFIVASTGVIGQTLPVQVIVDGIPGASYRRSSRTAHPTPPPPL